jgi:hypothetical protein
MLEESTPPGWRPNGGDMSSSIDGQTTNPSTKAPQRNFDRLPPVLRSIPNWMGYRIEGRSKPPINIRTGRKADPTDPSNFVSFDEAVAAYQKGRCTGIGYCLLANDNLTCVDLDNKTSDPEIDRQHRKLVEELNTYTEISPSGNGYHLWFYGKFAEGHRTHNIEIYSEKRFMTVTGAVYLPADIAPVPIQLTNLWESLRAAKGQVDRQTGTEVADEKIIHDILGEPKLGCLIGETYNLYSTDDSACDQALANTLLPRTSGNFEQGLRIWQTTPLGQRPKVQGRERDLFERAWDSANQTYRPTVLPMASISAKVLADLKAIAKEDHGLVQDYDEFTKMDEGLEYIVDDLILEGSFIAIAAIPGHGKTAVAVTLAVCVASGTPFGDHETTMSKVLYLAGENPGDVKRRFPVACQVLGIDEELVRQNLKFIAISMPLEDEANLNRIIDDAIEHGSYGLIIVDTKIAYSNATNENDAAQGQKFAEACFRLKGELSKSLVVLAHAAKATDKDNVTSRGSGAIYAAVDCEWACWMDLNSPVIQLFPNKVRGDRWLRMYLEAQKNTIPELVTKRGKEIWTVTAVPMEPVEHAATDGPKAQARRELKGANRIGLAALAACQNVGVKPPGAVLDGELIVGGAYAFAPFLVVPESVWRARCYADGISEGNIKAKEKAFSRARNFLLDAALVFTRADHYWLPDWRSTNVHSETEQEKD